MLTEPLSLTYGTDSLSLPRVKTGDYQSTYANADGTFTVDISSQLTKNGRVRHTLDFVTTKVVTDPLSSTNDTDSTTVRIIVDRPGYGFSVLDIQKQWTMVKTFVTDPVIAAIFGRQS